MCKKVKGNGDVYDFMDFMFGGVGNYRLSDEEELSNDVEDYELSDEEKSPVNLTISYMNQWRKDYKNAFKNPETFWDKFFMELERKMEDYEV